jgi:hypothetical protein
LKIFVLSILELKVAHLANFEISCLNLEATMLKVALRPRLLSILTYISAPHELLTIC